MRMAEASQFEKRIGLVFLRVLDEQIQAFLDENHPFNEEFTIALHSPRYKAI